MDSASVGEEAKLPQNCPDWVKITEIPHPALVPGFISRRECLPDGSIDPNTPSVSTQMALLQASTLSPSLSAVLSNVPSGLLCESIHRKNMKEVSDAEMRELKRGFVLTHSPAHYKRTGDPLLMPFNTVMTVGASSASATATTPSNSAALALANQTASELAAMNVLYGGVRGKAYLDSLRAFTESVQVVPGSRVDALLKERLNICESVCGFKVFAFPETADDAAMIDTSASLLDQNHQLCRALNSKNLSAEMRASHLSQLKGNLEVLMRDCPEEIKSEKLKGVDLDL